MYLKRKRLRKKKEERRRKGINTIVKLGEVLLCNTFSERESIAIKYQEHKMTYSVSSQIPIVVKPPAFVKDMMFCFN